MRAGTRSLPYPTVLADVRLHELDKPQSLTYATSRLPRASINISGLSSTSRLPNKRAMASVLRSHTGILREENIVLRQLFGYSLHTLESSPYRPPQIGHCLPGATIKDILLVAIDVDTGGGYQTISSDQSFHIGVSILDTRYFGEELDNPRNAIVSYQFINKSTPACQRAAKKFLFRETELLPLPDIASRISSLIGDRKYVLIAHGVKEDKTFFNNLDPTIVERASYVLDTVKAAQFPLNLHFRLGLESMLDKFGITYWRLHAAGNDAHFALRALLMIVVFDGRRIQETTGIQSGEEEKDLFRALDAIAHAPYPSPARLEEPRDDSTASQTTTKLGIKAKRRLYKQRKAARRALEELQGDPELGTQDTKDEHQSESLVNELRTGP